MTPPDRKHVRGKLLALGFGNYNATAVIPVMFLSAGTTDTKSVPVMLLVKALQNAMGVTVTGHLDDPDTISALIQIVGPNWERTTWNEIAQAVLDWRDDVRRYNPPRGMRVIPKDVKLETALGGPLDFLPDVPGGIFTYAAAGYLIYRALKNRKAA